MVDYSESQALLLEWLCFKTQRSSFPGMDKANGIQDKLFVPILLSDATALNHIQHHEKEEDNHNASPSPFPRPANENESEAALLSAVLHACEAVGIRYVVHRKEGMRGSAAIVEIPIQQEGMKKAFDSIVGDPRFIAAGEEVYDTPLTNPLEGVTFDADALAQKFAADIRKVRVDAQELYSKAARGGLKSAVDAGVGHAALTLLALQAPKGKRPAAEFMESRGITMEDAKAEELLEYWIDQKTGQRVNWLNQHRLMARAQDYHGEINLATNDWRHAAKVEQCLTDLGIQYEKSESMYDRYRAASVPCQVFVIHAGDPSFATAMQTLCSDARIKATMGVTARIPYSDALVHPEQFKVQLIQRLQRDAGDIRHTMDEAESCGVSQKLASALSRGRQITDGD